MLDHLKQQLIKENHCIDFFSPPTFNYREKEFKTLSKNYAEIRKDLLRAIAHNEIKVYYQPQICIKKQTVISVEALARWQHPRLGLIPPMEFIPLAEDLGLISAIDELVLAQACQYIKNLQKSGLYLSVSVNLSAETFKKPELTNIITQTLKNTKLEAKYLEIELTETMLLKPTFPLIKTMEKLKESGVKLSLDDFGTGYSGLLYLQQFPWDLVKIDRCFVNDLTNFSKNGVIISAIISLVHDLDLEIIAEGIEIESELNFLINNECYRSQGYLFSPPIPPTQLIETIQKINYQLSNLFPQSQAA